jgi:hypothetical protein
METCAYKLLKMYPDCEKDCLGNNPNRMCYITGVELKELLQQFQEVMFQDKYGQSESDDLSVGRLEEMAV